MSLLRLAVLGPPEVSHDGSRLSFALRKAEALLLYLAVESGMHPRSKLGAFLCHGWRFRWPRPSISTRGPKGRNVDCLLARLYAILLGIGE